MMKDAMHSNESVVAVRRDDTSKRRSRAPQYCSICTARIWFEPIELVEPEGVPEPRLSWVLCKACHQLLQHEMTRSPVRSPLRLRIAMGIVAAERWPHAYSTRVREYINDRRMILFIAIGLIVAMILHLILIVMVAGLR
ncbi:hypothetical protein KDH_44150 [Dictyobacter sp. S3.2.2.5]|uniref:Zinc-finger domain-containing protein n=1 Tax=Dictyobacter halimunensis TaxID=3026934 RepID=A0ABQ6FTH7_9CHLR|nr:hypothetical protein KDH_44150 [Dictyobacter sp. S3.2.2.5]